VSKLQIGLLAEDELERTADAFRAVSETYVRAALEAENADEAWEAVLRYRALTQVLRHLKSQIDGGRIEREAANRRAAEEVEE